MSLEVTVGKFLVQDAPAKAAGLGVDGSAEEYRLWRMKLKAKGRSRVMNARERERKSLILLKKKKFIIKVHHRHHKNITYT